MGGRSGILALLCALAGCSPHAEPAARTTTQQAPQHRRASSPQLLAPISAATSGRYMVTSSVAHMMLSTSASLPGVAPARDSNPECDATSIRAPRTFGGKRIAERGWYVMSEEKLGRLDAVAFVRKTLFGTGGLCPVEDGRVAIFDGDELIAILTAGAGAPAIGWIEPLENGSLRVWPSMPEPPIGDLALKGHRLEMSRVGARDSICQGMATVPNVFGKPIERARRIMINAGWKPIRAEEVPDAMTEGYHHFFERGVVEIDACASDSQGQCLFRYQSGGREVELMTAQVDGTKGEPVVLYNSYCGVQSSK